MGAIFQDADESIEYLCSVEVRPQSPTPSGLTLRTLAPQRYAVFHHEDHVAAIRDSWHAIWSGWVPGTAVEPAAAPALEIYGDAFDPATGRGGVELWLPIRIM